MKNRYKVSKVNGKNIGTHRLKMELHIGRKLTEEEVVHHIDGDRANNSIDNLILFPTQKAHAMYHFKIGDHGLKAGSNKKKLINGKLKCNRCGEMKEVEEFPTDSQSHLGLRGACKVCYRIQDKEWKQNRKEKI